MKRLGRELFFAFLAWAVPFGVSVCIFPLKGPHATLFDSLMGAALAGSTAGLACWYFRRVSHGSVWQGVRIGLLWMAANWALDALMFSAGPMKMSLARYAADIGLAYLMVPAITVPFAAGVAFARKNHRADA